MSTDHDDLSPQKKRFGEEYILDLNGTKAAIRAGYAADSAHVQSSRLLSNDKIQAYIAELKAERAKRNQLSADDIINFYREAATFDVFDIVDENGELLPLEEIPPQYRKLIQGIKRKQGKDGTEVEIKFVSREKAVEALAKHLGINDKVKIEHSGSISTDSEKLAKEISEITAILGLESKLNDNDNEQV